MPETAPVLPGRITFAERRFPVEVRYASRHSVWVALGGGDMVRLDETIDGLELELAEKTVDLGPCRVVARPDSDRRLFRVVPVAGFHDFDQLFFRSKVETLESTTMNLPLILSYKRSIDPHFRAFVSDINYDLNVYKNLLDRIDSECSEEPPNVQEIVQRGMFETIGVELMKYLDETLARLSDIVAGFSAQEHEHHGFYFRRQLWNVILCSPFMARTNLKPRGYSGDSAMMRQIYRNSHEGESTFGKIMHKHPVEHPAAQGVRNRREEVSRVLTDFVDRCSVPEGEKVRVLSVACGPAVEVGDILRTRSQCGRMHFSLLDQDGQALLEAASVVREVEERLETRISVDYIKESVRTMLVTKGLQERWGNFDFIYSMGLFDYLTAPVAAAVLKKLQALLNPSGEMIIGNFHECNPSRYYMEYWLDWKIIHRTEQELSSLASELPGVETEVLFDGTGVQMLLHVTNGNVDG